MVGNMLSSCHRILLVEAAVGMRVFLVCLNMLRSGEREPMMVKVLVFCRLCWE